MQLDSLELKNFRNHDDLTLEFKPGLNGLVGANGAGKSSVLEAIQFAFIGEGYKPREEIVKSGSVGQSLVRAVFTLNGQQGTIERHVNVSKIIVNYGGKTYSKATEVKELWADLLQIDSHIFKHVIIARQKKVAELLDTESSVREKAFQKIFLVPNTEKIRATIWDGYIKACPPPFAEEDVTGLQNRIKELEAQLGPISSKIERLNNAVLSQPQFEAVMGTTEYLKKCIRDAELRPHLEAQRSDANNKLQLLSDKITRLEETLSGVDLKNLQIRQKELLSNRAIAILKNQKLAEISKLKGELVITDEEALLVKDRVDKLSVEENDWTAKWKVAESQYEQISTDLNRFAGVIGHKECPTCHQALNDVAEFTAELTVRKEAIHKDITTISREYQTTSAARRQYQTLYEQYVRDRQRITNLEADLVRFKDVDFDSTELDNITNLIDTYTKNLADLNATKLT
jgi:DNA repair protein SbcC/Rad50